MIRRILAVAVAVLACGGPCAAQWTAGAFLGAVHTIPADLTISRPTARTRLTFNDTTFSDRSFESPLYYGYRVGRTVFRQVLFVEAELIHAKVYADAGPNGAFGSGELAGRPASDVPIGSVIQRFSMSHGLNFILANVGARKALHRGAFLVSRVGIGVVRPHAESEVAGQVREGYTWGGLAAHLAGGLELPIWSRLRGVIEYKFTRARPRVPIDAGTATVSVRSHHLAFGVSLPLGRHRVTSPAESHALVRR